MPANKIGFDEFIGSVDKNCTEFVQDLHQEFLNAGCKLEVKEAKSGYVVSYLLNKKTIANYVSRKKGLIVRIYANNINQYMDFLDHLPEDMVNDIKDASICKRLINPDDCNPRCTMGYDFQLHGDRYQKCRNNAFMFLICDEYKPYIKAFLQHELNACIG